MLTRTETAVAALMDHVVVMLDGTAYRAARDAAFLRDEFARVAVKESESSLAGTYTATAVLGTSTLVELFDVAAPPLPGVTAGLVLSFEVPGSAARAAALLTGAGVPFSYELVRRAVPGEAGMRPWYHLIRPDLGPGNPFLLMITEVTGDYFRAIGAAEGPGGTLRRRDYLDARLGSPPPAHHLLGDVTEVRVRLHPDRSARLRDALTTLGFTAEGPVLRGPDSVVHLTDGGTGPEGVTTVRVSLRRPADADGTHRFGGTSALTFRAGAHDAEWRFTPPEDREGAA
ncbi:hypothetical protein J2S43_002306 [Catenuloplanes nepalensis]|uniref:Glyoxalase-like domain-containing protein n=1 Tax=Catenuloplanes nepalensis TaxID=587533 RepID=A0ABT9MQT5_9ACTN|nr:DUF5829 family protein [Catenuloplanes nepalensis]MDP9793794.1 hypothetical protein [Catenuloplanes nepalensis]